MPKVLIATVKPFAPEAIKGMRELFNNVGYETEVLEKYQEQNDLIQAVENYDALVVRSDKVTKEVIDAASNLKIVVRGGAGYDNVDLEAASVKNIVVMNTPGQNANAVAELAFGMMVYQARNQFNGKAGRELMSKSLGLHAYGNVGKCMARIAKGFAMEVSAFDPFLDKETIEQDGVKFMDNVEDLYRSNQYVSLHIPANEETRESINYNLLSLMPENGVLVNSARKEVIHEGDLLKIFNERDDFQYVSDIAPDCKEELQAKYNGRFYFTPKKMGAQTKEANINAGLAAAKQIIAFFEKGDTNFQVNK
ncbi:MAG: 3-phosphoglycerate dehydrogenase [Caldithrix sp.]|nr:3-phosphoglycerate dehydrogenase [Caldithrix sp.]